MAELIPTVSEAEWLEARRKGVTASEIAVIMGLSPWSSPYALYHQKLGILPGQVDSAVMERGRVLEPYVVEKFTAAHPEFTLIGDGRELFAHSDRPWQMATTDRDVYAASGMRECLVRRQPPAVLEVKTASDMSDWGELGTDEIPVYYRAQVLWQMDVRGVARAHVAVLDVPRWEVREYVVTHDDSPVIEYPHDIPGPLAPGICRACGDLELMHQAARDFLDRIDRQEPPEVDWRPATIGALKALNPDVEDREAVIGRQLAISYRAAVKHAKAAEQRKDEMTARLLLAMGNAKRATEACTDKPVAARSVSRPKRIDTERLRTEQPAIAAEYTKPPKPEVKLTPATPKKEKNVSADGK